VSGEPVVRHIVRKIEPGGGPRGYVEQLRSATARFPEAREGIQFDFREVPAQPAAAVAPGALAGLFTRAKWAGYRRLVGAEQARFAASFQDAWEAERTLFDHLREAEVDDLLRCDLLFVHEVQIARRIAFFRPAEARERLVLLTHSPTFYAHQWVAYLRPEDNHAELAKIDYVRRAVQEELEMMLGVRAVAWPFPEAEEGYREWVKARAEGRGRVVYAPTGVRPPEPGQSVESLHAAWGITAEQKVALFMGRPHPDKGFGPFLEWARASAAGHDGWTFVFAGPEARHFSPDLSHVRAVGYVHDNAAAYLAASLVLIPNRFSYLDIGLLECLALGAPVATTATGGHRAVLRLVPEVIDIPQGPAPEAWSAMRQRAEDFARQNGSDALRRGWQQHFSPACFVRAHAHASRELLGRAAGNG
jgi:hypothetical protein